MLRRAPLICKSVVRRPITRNISTDRIDAVMPRGILLPVSTDGRPYLASSTATSKVLGDIDTAALWSSSGAKARPGETRVFYAQGVNKDIVLALVGAGNVKHLSHDELAERSRVVAAAGVKALRDVGVTEVEIETGSDGKSADGGLNAHAAAAAAKLALFRYDWKTAKADLDKKKAINVSDLDTASRNSSSDAAILDWKTGEIYAEAQNMARILMETPANMMTATMFAENVQKSFDGIQGITVNVYDEDWARSHKMGSFLSVTAGSDEPAKFVEILYDGDKSNKGKYDVAYVGKGITFDTGGISLKPGADMKAMRADMGGAAVTVSALWAIAKLKMPINMVLCTPLTDNMPSGKATHPGDIVTAMNGKTIEVDNTDAEGRLVLADALYYATSKYKPNVVINAATLTGAMAVSVADVYSGVFASDDKLWKDLDAAGEAEHDRVWRFSMDPVYKEYINKTGADFCNTGGRYGGSAIAAVFLKEFIDGLLPDDKSVAKDDDEPFKPSIAWAHLDIAGCMQMGKGSAPYDINGGMSGRPTRTLIEYIRRRAYKL